MARIEHRRYVRPLPPADARLDVAVAGQEDAEELIDPAAPGPKPPGALDRLSFIGWVWAGIALGWLVLQLWPLLGGGAFADARRVNDIITVVRAFSGAAALALPAALEFGVPKAWSRVPWLYRGAVLLAVAEFATIVLGQVQQRFLADIDLNDPSQPVALAFAVASLAPPIAMIGGLWALSDGLWDVGARPSRWILRIVGGAAVLVTLLTYIPYFGQLFSTDALLISGLNVLRLAVSLGLLGITAVAGTHLLSGAIGNLTPRWAWVFAGLAGASYVLSAFGQAATGIPIPQDLLLSLYYAVFALESAPAILLVLAFALGLGRTALAVEPPRRLVARWVRYPAA
jgi:hypothetical protein